MNTDRTNIIATSFGWVVRRRPHSKYRERSVVLQRIKINESIPSPLTHIRQTKRDPFIHPSNTLLVTDIRGKDDGFAHVIYPSPNRNHIILLWRSLETKAFLFQPRDTLAENVDYVEIITPKRISHQKSPRHNTTTHSMSCDPIRIYRKEQTQYRGHCQAAAINCIHCYPTITLHKADGVYNHMSHLHFVIILVQYSQQSCYHSKSGIFFNSPYYME